MTRPSPGARLACLQRIVLRAVDEFAPYDAVFDLHVSIRDVTFGGETTPVVVMRLERPNPPGKVTTLRLMFDAANYATRSPDSVEADVRREIQHGLREFFDVPKDQRSTPFTELQAAQGLLVPRPQVDSPARRIAALVAQLRAANEVIDLANSTVENHEPKTVIPLARLGAAIDAYRRTPVKGEP